MPWLSEHTKRGCNSNLPTIHTDKQHELLSHIFTSDVTQNARLEGALEASVEVHTYKHKTASVDNVWSLSTSLGICPQQVLWETHKPQWFS